jgi:hypothetical protein
VLCFGIIIIISVSLFNRRQSEGEEIGANGALPGTGGVEYYTVTVTVKVNCTPTVFLPYSAPRVGVYPYGGMARDFTHRASQALEISTMGSGAPCCNDPPCRMGIASSSPGGGPRSDSRS